MGSRAGHSGAAGWNHTGASDGISLSVDRLRITGGRPLAGEIPVSGAKNAALPIIAATILSKGKCVLENVPLLKDVDLLGQILRSLGVSCERRADGAFEARS